MYKDMTKGDDLNKEKFCKNGFLDVMMWRFVDVLKDINYKRPISRNVSECWSGYILTLLEGKCKETRKYISTYTGMCRDGYGVYMQG